MNSLQNTGRITGILLLFVFVSGVVVFQVLQGPYLFSDNFLSSAFANANSIVSSTVLGIASGIISIVISVVVFPIFKEYSIRLGLLYIAFCILNFISIMIDNVSVISMLELSKEFVEKGNDDTLKVFKNLVYQRHFWTHYFYLLISCFPVFVFYYGLYVTKVVPRVISIFGLIAVIIMFVEELSSIYGNSISMNMLLPIGLVQLLLPLWLLVKGFKPCKKEKIKELYR